MPCRRLFQVGRPGSKLWVAAKESIAKFEGSGFRVLGFGVLGFMV